MNDELDRTLRGTLASAAREAPAVPPGLPAQVEAGYRRRRNRRTGAAALAVAVVLGGTGAVGAAVRSGEGAAPVATAGKLKKVSLAGLGTPVKVRERWPDAIRDIPSELPNGSALHPITMLDGDTLLASSTSSFEKTDKLWAYDLKARKASAVTDVVVPKDSTTFASDFTVGGGWVVWWLARGKGGAATVEIWGAPVQGGPARKITGMADAGLSTLLIDGGDVVWAMKTGVYKAPLTGGVPRKLPGSEGFQVVSWPWIGSPAQGERLGDVQYESLRNVRTGERVEATLAPYKGAWSCSVTWCVGNAASGVTYHGEPPMAVQRRDGKAGRSLPPNQYLGAGILFDRFLPYRPTKVPSGDYLLYDLKTGKLLDTGIRQYNSGTVPSSRRDDRDPLVFLSNKDGTKLIDLSKIR
jgi:hypothetical protein